VYKVDIDVGKVDIEGGEVSRDYPGEFEHMVLLAILRLRGEAFALAIIRELEAEVGRHVSRGALYKTLDRLEGKGHLTWTQEATTPERGGHPRRLFAVTPEGVRVLRASREALFRLWDGLDPILGERPA
jgi:PadR family transcriptional regulator PadR